MYKPKVNSYFSGAGLFDLGLTQGGLEIQQSLEIDPVCADTLKNNFNHSVLNIGIQDQLVGTQPDSDVMAFTYPCTKYSDIANIHDTRTGDELYLHALRHLAVKRPEAYVLENVPGMRKFPIVMEAMSKMPDYHVQIFCPIDTLHWLPQKRKRLILIGTKKPFTIFAPEAVTRIKLKDIIEKDPQVHIPDNVYSRMKGNYRDKPIISNPDNDDVAPTCVAHYAKDRGTRLVADKNFKMGVRPYTVREFARLQGVPDEFKFSGTEANQFLQIGNGVGIPVGRWAGQQLLRYFN